MAKSAKKSLPANAKGRSALSGLAAADLERRRFDARLVDSALRYLSAAGEQPDQKQLPALAEDHFGWIRSAVTDHASEARVPKSDAVLGSITVLDAATAEQIFHGFFQLWFGTTYKSGGVVDLRPHQPGEPIVYEAGRKFLDEHLKRLWIVECYRLTRSGIARVAIPYLPNVAACMAYVIAMLMENRWGLADRVKVCPFRPDPDKGFHVFLNFRLREDGNLMDGAGMKYCCEQHQNSDGQRRHRTKARKHK